MRLKYYPHIISTLALIFGMTGSAVAIHSIRGPRGPQGKEGREGIQGKMGPAGLEGRTGPPGPTGKDGTNANQIGPMGPTGPRGNTGEQGLPDKINFVGTWTKYNYYKPPQIVGYNGAFWEAVNPVHGEEPTTKASNWALLLPAVATGERGNTGPTGSTGPTGPTGPTGTTK